MSWWLILCVNLTELNYAQRADKTLFLGASVEVFPEGISIWISRLSKESLLCQCEPAPFNLLRAWIEKKKIEEELNCPLFFSLNIHLLLPSDPRALGSHIFKLWDLHHCQTFGLGLGILLLSPLVIRPLDSDWISPLASWFSSLQMAGSENCWPL